MIRCNQSTFLNMTQTIVYLYIQLDVGCMYEQ